MTYKRKDENNGYHLERIIRETPCTKHGAEMNEPCWALESNHGPIRAICDRRARLAGAQGKITPYQKESSR